MVYIDSLGKDLWPFYLKPQKNELFSSWIYRMSIESNVKPIPFINSCFGRNISFWNRDIDLNIPENIIRIIANHTPLNRGEVENMSLKKYLGFAFESIDLNSLNKNISSLGIRHRKRRKFGLTFCPSCLNDNYFRVSWRLLTTIVCLECREYLYDRCLKCGSPVSFHRINVGESRKINPNLFDCFNCGYDLRNMSRIQKPKEEELYYQKFIDSTIAKGYNFISNYSFSYIWVLLVLSSKLKTTSKFNQFKINFEKFYNVKINQEDEIFNFLSIRKRRGIIVLVNKMLMNWPKSYFDLHKLKRFNNSHLVDNLAKMPFWAYYHLKFKY